MKWITRLTIVAVFLLGAVCGALLGMKLEREKLLNMQRKGAASLTERALERISNEVNLAPAQQSRLMEILKKVEPALAAIENERRTKIVATMETVRTGALAFLDASQLKSFNALHERIKSRLAPLAGEIAASAALMAWF